MFKLLTSGRRRIKSKIRIAVFGASKSGKSTLINFLIGVESSLRTPTKKVTLYSSDIYPDLLELFGRPVELFDTPSSCGTKSAQIEQDVFAAHGKFDIHILMTSSGDGNVLKPLIRLLDSNTHSGTRMMCLTHMLAREYNNSYSRIRDVFGLYMAFANVSENNFFVFEPRTQQLVDEWKIVYSMREHERLIETLKGYMC